MTTPEQPPVYYIAQTPAIYQNDHLLLANPGVRLGAWLIDLVIGYVVLAGGVFLTQLGGDTLAQVGPAIIFAVLVATYSPVLTATRGGTVGKLLCGLRVVRLETGERLSYWRALSRHLSHLTMHVIPILGLVDKLFCTWDLPYRQCLHDKVAATVVIRRGGTAER
ncbi:MAG: RDD family protein [Nonomuraea sp.]|nr:RDD family protein [Nonomuraea sp.]